MQTPDFSALRRNILDVVKESQLKIGYTPNAVSLYYPPDSLNRFLGTELEGEALEAVLQKFAASVRDTLGDVLIKPVKGRYCITLPPEGAAYVHEHVQDSGFLTELVALLSGHGNPLTIEDILAVFRKYSDCVRCVESDNEEFGYLVWFEDGVPDSYRYCIDIDLGHATYHRYTPADFEAFGFGMI